MANLYMCTASSVRNLCIGFIPVEQGVTGLPDKLTNKQKTGLFFQIKIKRLPNNKQPIFLFNGKLSGKPVTSIYLLNISMQ